MNIGFVVSVLVVLFCVAIFQKTGSIGRVVRFLVGYFLWPIGMTLLGAFLGISRGPVIMALLGAIGFVLGIIIAFKKAAKHNGIQ